MVDDGDAHVLLLVWPAPSYRCGNRTGKANGAENHKKVGKKLSDQRR
jgi:hypothetical protein